MFGLLLFYLLLLYTRVLLYNLSLYEYFIYIQMNHSAYKICAPRMVKSLLIDLLNDIPFVSPLKSFRTKLIPMNISITPNGER